MKTMMSYSYDPISCVPDVSNASNATTRAVQPLGLSGHLRAAISAWHAERQARKADKAVLTKGAEATRKLSDLTAAELHEARFDRGDQFAQYSFTRFGLLRAGDVLSGMVLAWPKPSDKHR
jgi:hypothetical protein